jgi:hypothetical protein
MKPRLFTLACLVSLALLVAIVLDKTSPTVAQSLSLAPAGPTTQTGACPANPLTLHGASVFGRVLDEQGAARQGLRVRVMGPGGAVLRETRTDAEGQYRFAPLPAGHYVLRALDEHRRPLLTGDSFEVAPTDTEQWLEHDLVLSLSTQEAHSDPTVIQATGRITGVVTAADTGLPLSDVAVDVYDAATWTSKGFDWTDSQGQYTIDTLETGAYKVQFEYWSGPYVSQWYDNKPAFESATPINVTDGATTANINAVMQRGGQITGKVTAADTGLLLRDVGVTVYDCADEWVDSDTTDATGVYTIAALPTGNYFVGFSPSRSGSAAAYVSQYYDNKSRLTTADVVHVTAPNTVNNINAVLIHGGQITGRVTAADGGAGLANVSVTVLDVTLDDYVNYPTTDASGVFTTTGLPTGNYKLRFSPPSTGAASAYVQQYYSNKSSWMAADVVNVTAPNIVTNINPVLARGGQITGRVTAAGTDLQLSGISVQVNNSSGAWMGTFSTNASGVYTTAGLPTGSYRVKFAPGYWLKQPYIWEYYNNRLTWATADAVNVTAPNLESNVDAALESGGQISGTIKAADTGWPLETFVDVYDSSGNYVVYAWSDQNGAYLTPGLPAGDYRVEFEGGDIVASCSVKTYAGQYYNNKPDLASANPVHVNASGVTPNINANLSVVVTGPPGVPTLLTPPNGTVTTTQGTAFTWNAGTGQASTGYNLNLDGNVITTTGTTWSAILPVAVHTWKVRAYNTAGYSAWTSAWTIDIRMPSAPPGVPTLVAPPDGTVTNILATTFAWNAGAGTVTTGYDVQLDNNIITTTNTTWPTVLSVGVHTWTVRAFNAAGYSAWASPARTITVQGYRVCLPVVLRQ